MALWAPGHSPPTATLQASDGSRASPPSIPPGGGICSPHPELRRAKSSAHRTQLASCPTTLPGQDTRALGNPCRARVSQQGNRPRASGDRVLMVRSRNPLLAVSQVFLGC